MRKRRFGMILTVLLAAVQTVTVTAAGSRTAQVTLAGAYADYYQVSEGTRETFAYLEGEHPQILEAVLAVNAGEKDLTHIIELAPDLGEGLRERVLVTPFFDLSPVNGGILTEEGKYLVKFEVPSLTEEMTEVHLLHYSTVRSIWEILEPVEVDPEQKTIEAVFEDLSPVAVIARSAPVAETTDADAVPDTKVGGKQQMEEGTYAGSSRIKWGIGAAAAVLAAGLFAAALKKLKKK